MHARPQGIPPVGKGFPGVAKLNLLASAEKHQEGLDDPMLAQGDGIGRHLLVGRLREN